MSIELDKKFYTVKEFSEIVRSCPQTIHNWIKNGVIRNEYIYRPSGAKKGAKLLIEAAALRITGRERNSSTSKNKNIHERLKKDYKLDQ